MQATELQARIQILPEHIANQIAAGEVVQRPESVVKEVVENAIDAGATHITVVVRSAGKTLIHILDNGRGMSRQDLALALKRHATSKIRTADDLHAILTLGFRGEALASIASVAHVEIRTREANADHGWKLSSEPLREEVIEPIHQEQGTQIFIRNLFYNIPARKKFLRSDITEFRHISDTMMKFALSYPSLRFTFHDGDSLIFDLMPSPLLERIESLFGRDVALAAMPVDYTKGEVHVSGYVCKPLVARTTKATQFFFLNNRYFTSKSLSHAVYQGYEHLIDKTQHPLYVLSIAVNPEKVDVNIHPQKTEVKFEDERMMYSCIQEAVMQTLRSNNLVPDVRFGLQNAQSPFEKVEYGFSTASNNDMMLVNKLTGEIIEQQRQPSSAPHFTQNSQRMSGTSGGSSTNQQFEKTNAWNPHQMSAFDSLFRSSERKEETPEPIEQALPEKHIWQMHNKYIFVQTDEGIVVIDQHIAHERILYEKALRLLANPASRSQKLLFTVTIQLSPTELILFRELSQDLLHLGYDADEGEGGMVNIKGVPNDVRSGEEADSLKEILEQYAEYQTIRPASSHDNIAASYGCRNAIKAGDPLRYPEMKQLIDDLYACHTPEVCPHGRPVMIQFELKEFDRRFGRTS